MIRELLPFLATTDRDSADDGSEPSVSTNEVANTDDAGDPEPDADGQTTADRDREWEVESNPGKDTPLGTVSDVHQ